MKRPRDPTRPRSFTRRNGYRPRQPGEQVTYTPDATERYKSLQMRLLAALDITAQWGEQVTELASDTPGYRFYYFQSERATDGYWTVICNEGAPANPPYTPEPPPASSPEPGGGGVPYNPDTIYISYLDGTFQPGLPPWLLRATESSFGVPGSAVSLPWLDGEVLAPGVTILDTEYGANGPQIETLTDQSGQTLSQIGAYWVRNIKLYSLNTGPEILVLYRWVGAPPYPLAHDASNAAIRYELPDDFSEPLIYEGFAEPYPATPQQPPGTQPTDPETLPGVPPNLTPPLPPTRPPAKYECNCPDFLKVELADLNSPFPSRHSDRDWRESDAGAPVGANGQTYCKHVLATMLYRGDSPV